MRTTIEIPVALRQKLTAEALSRNMKGYSKIIVEALSEYFRKDNGQRKRVVKKLKGCLSKKEYEWEVKRLDDGRNNWRA